MFKQRSEEPEPALQFFRSILRYLDPPEASYELTRTIFLRFFGFLYFIAFLCANRQIPGLIGADGILPAQRFLHNAAQQFGGSTFHQFIQLPSLFWWNCSDSFLILCTYAGLFLSTLMIAGVTNATILILQWFLYLSLVHIGQLFYGYGWETMMLETGFLGIFLCPVKSARPFPAHDPAPGVVMWFYRWMLFRVMFGAGMIKIHGDVCWRDLTCLAYHYETQPLPNPVSWYLHQMPLWFHQAGCLFNHFAELIVPWFYFAPRKLRHWAGALTILFQTILIISGNLSFLNWLTIAIAIPCFDDEIWRRVFRLRPRAVTARPGRARRITLYILTVMIIYLSVDPALNLFSSHQLMNASFDRLHLLNTYGAFGSITKIRNEIIIEGTNDPVADDSAHWQAYEFLAKPGDPRRRPAFIAPYQSRIDWQMWFAAMSDYRDNPWFVHFIYKLLQGDPHVVGLLKSNPFPDGPPRFIRAELYEYHFTSDRSVSGAWWTRKRVATYLPPLAKDDPRLLRFLQLYDW